MFVPGGAHITEPEQTTAAGKLAKQHIVATNAAGASLVLGTVDTFAKSVELRGYSVVAAVHQERFCQPPSFDAAAYDALVGRIRSTLTSLGVLDVVLVTEADARPGRAVSPAIVTVVLAVAIGALIGAAAIAFLRG